MSFGLIFWVLMLLWLIFGLWGYYRPMTGWWYGHGAFCSFCSCYLVGECLALLFIPSCMSQTNG